MSQAARSDAFKSAGPANRAATSPLAAGTAARDVFGSVQSTWRRNIRNSLDTARALHEENAEFAGRLLELNLRAMGAFSPDRPVGERVATPLELGASAFEIYLRHLGRSAALAQQAILVSWTKPVR